MRTGDPGYPRDVVYREKGNYVASLRSPSDSRTRMATFKPSRAVFRVALRLNGGRSGPVAVVKLRGPEPLTLRRVLFLFYCSFPISGSGHESAIVL